MTASDGARLLRWIGTTLDGLTVVVDDTVAAGDWVIGRGRGQAVDGKVVEIIEYLDTELVTTVLGR